MKAALAVGLLAALGLVSTAGATFPGRNGLIAFSSLIPNSSPGILSISPDGSGSHFLTQRPDEYPAAVSPDGKSIAVVREGTPSIWLMRAGGGGRRKLADGFGPTWSPDGRRLAFSSPGADRSSVSVINADGSGLHELTPGAYPAWSPDGSRIAFYRFGDRGTELDVIRPDGSGETRIAESVETHGFDGPPRPPSWSPTGQRLAFVARDGLELVVANADGTGLDVVLRSGPRRLSQPMWSPRGDLIAFVSYRGDSTIEVLRPAGGKPRSLARGATPVWSPDGRSLAYTTEDRNQLLVVPAVGGRPRQLTDHEPGARVEGVPVWVPGGRLLYAHSPGSDDELLVVRPDGRGLRQLTHDDRLFDEQPAWSPDGRRIAFARGARAKLFVMWADGSHVRRLTRQSYWEHSPAWSPDGRRIAFVRELNRAGNGLAVMRADGGDVRVLVSVGGSISSPTWSPDGSQIAFVRDLQLEVVNADGTGLQPIVAGDAEQHYPSDPDWSPDGQRILFVLHNPCGGACDVPSLVTIRPDGTDEQVIAGPSGLEQPAWSPDGTMIAAVGSGELQILRADGTPVRSLRVLGSNPAWQPLRG